MPTPPRARSAQELHLLRWHSIALVTAALGGSILSSSAPAQAQDLRCQPSELSAAPVGRYLDAPSDLAELAARALVPDEELRTGRLGSAIVVGALAAVCTDDLETTLPLTCSPWESRQALIELRRRLALDILHIPGKVLGRPALGISASERESLLLAAVLLEAIATSVRLETLAEQLMRRTALAGCPPSGSLTRRSAPWTPRLNAVATRELFAQAARPTPPGRQLDPLVVASRVLVRLVSDGPSVDKPTSYYVAIVENELRTAMADGGYSLTPFQRAAAEHLVDALRRSRQVEQALQTSADRRAGLSELARAWAMILGDAVALAENRPAMVPPQTLDAITSLAHGDMPAAWSAMMSILPQAYGRPLLPPGATTAVATAARLAAIRSSSDAQELLTDMVLPTPPWSDRYLFDINGGALKPQQSNLALAADAGFGYNADDWGGYLHGAYGRYRLVVPGAYSETTAGGGDIDTWMLLADDGTWRLEGRLSVGVHAYRTQNVATSGAGTFFTQEQSTMGRGVGLAGIRYQPDLRFAAGAWVGLGGQYERYTPLRWDTSNAIHWQRDDTVHVMFTSRVRAQYALSPGDLSLRLRSDLQSFRITRNSLAVDLSGATVDQSQVQVSSSQVEASSRLFVDFDALELSRFVPSAFIGLDVYSLKSPDGRTTTADPVFGAGIRRDVF